MDDSIEISVSELMELFRREISHQRDFLAQPLAWLSEDGIHDAWESLISATFDSVVRQPIEAIQGRGYKEYRLPKFGFPITGTESIAWISSSDNPFELAFWGIDVNKPVGEYLSAIENADTGWRQISLNWDSVKEFVFVRTGPDRSPEVIRRVLAVE